MQQWRTVMLESWDSSAEGDDSCAAPETAASAITPQASHLRFLDRACHLPTIRKLEPGIMGRKRKLDSQENVICGARWGAGQVETTGTV
jgi:hypothetical protein